MRKITIKEIYSKNPCKEGFAKLLYSVTKNEIFNTKLNILEQFSLLTHEQKNMQVSLEDILISNGVKDAYWALRCCEYEEYCLLLANVAESVLHIFERENKSKAPRETIEAIRKYKRGEISKNELNMAAVNISRAVASASRAVAAAAYAATYASASLTVAYAASDSATRAAADAYAYDYAASRAVAAASDAAYAANAAYANAAYDAAWKLNEKLMLDFINSNEEIK